jgi:hypothetical protein
MLVMMKEAVREALSEYHDDTLGFDIKKFTKEDRNRYKVNKAMFHRILG